MTRRGEISVGPRRFVSVEYGGAVGSGAPILDIRIRHRYLPRIGWISKDRFVQGLRCFHC